MRISMNPCTSIEAQAEVAVAQMFPDQRISDAAARRVAHWFADGASMGLYALSIGETTDADSVAADVEELVAYGWSTAERHALYSLARWAATWTEAEVPPRHALEGVCEDAGCLNKGDDLVGHEHVEQVNDWERLFALVPAEYR